MLLLIISPKFCANAWNGFAPQSRADLKKKLDNCLEESPPVPSIANWDVSNVMDMSGMFQSATSFNCDISEWRVSRVANMRNMFKNAKSFEQKLCGASWVNSNAFKEGMFERSPGSISETVCKTDTDRAHTPRQIHTTRTPPGPKVLTKEELKSLIADYLTLCRDGVRDECFKGGIREWDVSGITDMADIFFGINLLNGDISNWDVSSVTTMNSMFMSAKYFDGDLSKWDVSNVLDMSNMFFVAKKFKGYVSTGEEEGRTRKTKKAPSSDSRKIANQMCSSDDVSSKRRKTGVIKAIFLDIDGVLLPFGGDDEYYTSEFSRTAVAELDRILRAVPDAEIVLSSTWRCGDGQRVAIRQLQKMSTGKLGQMTEFRYTTSEIKHDIRQWEIAEWLDLAPTRGILVTHWVAIDDEELVAFTDKKHPNAPRSDTFRGHVVKTDSAVGLTAEGADLAIRILRGEEDEDEQDDRPSRFTQLTLVTPRSRPFI